MTQPIWKEIRRPHALPGEPKVYWREMSNGSQESCTENDAGFMRWLEEGNTPLPADEPPVAE
jgi:hypothetical protein